jgi:thioredoxin 1
MTQSLTKSDFETKVLSSQTPVLVDFFAPWCGPCQALSPVIDELAAEGVAVYKVDVDTESELAGEYGVMSIPTLKVFKDGKIVEEAMGMQSKEALKEMLEKHQ